MTATRTCPKCEADVPPNAPSGICPRCLMQAGLENAGEPQEPLAASPFAATTPRSGGFVPLRPASLAEYFPQLEILALLGHGGMGAVYKARQSRLDRVVALKIIRPESADDPTFAVRFNREAKALARLNHRNIVGVHDFGEIEYIAEDGAAVPLYYFLMEYVDGVNLRSLIRAGHTKPAQALPIVLQICEALQYAHDQGVVHRDIKPENILLDTTGHLKIADFGLAKLGREADDLQLSGTQQVLGTVQYMAPEQIAQSKTVDHRADIYSMGDVFYELLTGEIPLGAFVPPSHRADVDSRLDDVVMKTLATDPNQRYQSASEVGGQVSSISASGSSSVRPQQSEYWPGPSTLVENGAAAFANGVHRIMNPAASRDDDDHSPGHSDVTMTLKKIRSDTLPDVCIVCGVATRRRLSHEFSHTSETASWLMVLLMVRFFPLGIYAAIALPKRVRMSVPVCAKHRTHWARLAWSAGLGTLLILSGVAAGFWLGEFNQSPGRGIVIFVGCILTGAALYLIPLVYLATTRVTAVDITDNTMTLRRVSVHFARAIERTERTPEHAAGRDRAAPASPPQ